MKSIPSLFSLPLIIVTAAALLQIDGVDQSGILLARHASGCSHSTNWQEDSENSTAPACDNGTGLNILKTTALVNKTDCQGLIQKISSKAGNGHWEMQWDCDGGSPDRLDSSGACGFEIDNVTTSNPNT